METYSLANMNCVFSLPERPYEIVCMVSKKMVNHEGFSNFDDAVAFAELLASENPGRGFMVYGPLSLSKATVPVETHVFEEPVKAE